ncbi:MAG: cyclopropane-fatty-acyl-phospholipid synthase family protein [Hyphomicrobiales bacterium]|nr:cyclopropane-fatty-acyl-phospholipid synthase family protein [Hyphomicrobiales bacterium]
MTTTPAASARRADAALDVLRHVHRVLDLAFGFELWDGRTVPSDLAPDGLRIFVGHEGAVTRLLRRPTVSTLIDLHAEGLIDLRGGTLFDVFERRPKVRTRAILKALDKGLLLRRLAPFLFAPAAPPPAALTGVARAGSGGSDKADIEFHYDVSNDFYRLFLDPSMVYTCAYFRDWSNDLATAQADKLDMICRKLRLKPGDRFLDIGSGWGALVCHAAEHYGVTALGVTLSTEQLEFSRARIAERGLSDRVRVELQDYRTLDGQFDKISSIGMFEAVGFDNYDAYFETIRRLLVDRGLYLHHAITRRGKKDLKRFRRKRSEYEALTRYVFPGGEVDHIGLTLTNLEEHGFEVHDVEGWREHYARTTELWARALSARFDEAAAIVGAPKTRIWILYLAGVSLGFRTGSINLFQTVASKRTRGPSGLPPTREDLYA